MFERDSTRGVTTREPDTRTTPSADRPAAREDALVQADAGGGSGRRRPRERVLHGWFVRSLAVVAEVGIAFLIREAVAHRDPEFAPFITFYPAMLLACLLDGLWAGIAVTVLAAVVAQIWIFAPVGSLRVADPYDVLSLAIFLVFGVSLSIVIELYHRNREKLAGYRVEEAVSEERRKQEEERKLAETVRAERQRLFEVMEALPAMVSLRRPDHKISFANRGFREKFGDPGDRRCYQMRFGRSEPCVDCETFLPLETGAPHHREISFPDNTVIEAYDFPFTDLDGTSMVLEMGLDVTARRRAEAELKRHREHLEELVAERTRQVEAANTQLAAEIHELEKAKQELGESRARLEAALSSMKDSVIITDTEGKFLAFNEAYVELYRFKNKEECVRNFAGFTNLFEVRTLEGAPLTKEMFPTWRALRGETGSNVEYQYQRKDTGQSWIASLSFSPVRSEEGIITGAVITARDVTERKGFERELANARARAEQIASQLRTIFDNVEERIYVCDRDGNTIMANHVARRTYGDKAVAPAVPEMEILLEVSDMEGKPLARVDWPISRVLRGEKVQGMEIRVVFKGTSQERILSCNGSAIRDENGEILMAVLTSVDITERKRAEDALRESEKIALQREQFQALAVRLRRAREEERTRVARDLHDQIGQILTAIKFDLMWMSRHLPEANNGVRERLNGTVGLINEGVRSVRTICSGLRPGVLDDVGLGAAIEWQANEFSTRTGIECVVSAPSSDLALGEEQATEVFRIFQECLTNVMRHAAANSVSVTLQEEGGDLVLMVADDGKGFQEADVSGSLGFLGMRERAQVCRGSVEIASLPGSGTTVVLRVPLHSDRLSDSDYAHSDHG